MKRKRAMVEIPIEEVSEMLMARVIEDNRLQVNQDRAVEGGLSFVMGDGGKITKAQVEVIYTPLSAKTD